jgi:hypothetical protein
MRGSPGFMPYGAFELRLDATAACSSFFLLPDDASL